MCPRSGSHDLASDFPLVDVDHFSKKSALSGMLLKQWNKEKDISSELKQWVRTRNRDEVWPRHSDIQGAQWLSGRVLDWRPRGCGLEPHQCHCVVVLEQDTFILA